MIIKNVSLAPDCIYEVGAEVFISFTNRQVSIIGLADLSETLVRYACLPYAWMQAISLLVSLSEVK